MILLQEIPKLHGIMLSFMFAGYVGRNDQVIGDVAGYLQLRLALLPRESFVYGSESCFCVSYILIQEDAEKVIATSGRVIWTGQ
jgi:hypothetical protein